MFATRHFGNKQGQHINNNTRCSNNNSSSRACEGACRAINKLLWQLWRRLSTKIHSCTHIHTPTGTHRLRNKLLAYQAQLPMNTHCKILSTHIGHRSWPKVRLWFRVQLLGALVHVNVQVELLLLPVHLHSCVGFIKLQRTKTNNERKEGKRKPKQNLQHSPNENRKHFSMLIEERQGGNLGEGTQKVSQAWAPNSLQNFAQVN